MASLSSMSPVHPAPRNLMACRISQLPTCCGRRARWTTTRDRCHDETATGALSTATSTTMPKARVSYVAQYYDLADRLTATVNIGTNGGLAYARSAADPAGSDTVLVTGYAYSSGGWVA